MCQQFHALLPRRIQCIRGGIERTLGHADRQRAMAFHGRAPLECFFEQVFLRHAFVDEPDLDRFLRGEAARAENHLARQPLAEDQRQVLRRAHRRTRSDFRAGLSQHRVFGRDHHVAPEGQLVAAAHAPPVDHGNHWNRQAAYRHRESQHTVVPHVGIGKIKPLHRKEIAAGREGFVAGAGHHRAHDGGIFPRGLQRVYHLVERLLAKRVEHARPVDGDPRDLVLDLVQDIRVFTGLIARLRRLAALDCHDSNLRENWF